MTDPKQPTEDDTYQPGLELGLPSDEEEDETIVYTQDGRDE